MSEGFITQGVEFTGKELLDIILRPIFKGENPVDTGFRVVLNVKSKTKITFFSKNKKLLKKYADGFQGASPNASKQLVVETEEFKAEEKYSKQDYRDTILEEITERGGSTQNDISGTAVHDAQVRVFMNGVESDIFRIAWLGDKAKKTVTAGVIDDGTPDIDYNVIDGVLLCIKKFSDTQPDGTPISGVDLEDQIKRIVIDNGTAAQDEDWTVAGVAGTLSLTINQVAYTEAFDTSAEVTSNNWIATHTAALAALGIIVTDGGSAIISFLAAVAGTPYVITDTSTGGMSATIGVVVANDPADDLGTDEAKDAMNKMMKQSPQLLKTLFRTGMLRFYCTFTWLENYQESLEADGTERAHIKTEDGQDTYFFRGIPLIPMGWDEDLDADFIEPFPHRCVLTMPDNLVLNLVSESDFGELKMWFNPDENQNRQRIQFRFGVGTWLPEWIVAAY